MKSFKAEGAYVAWDPRTKALVFSIKDSTENIFQGRETFTVSEPKVVQHILKGLGFERPEEMVFAQGRGPDIRLELLITRR